MSTRTPDHIPVIDRLQQTNLAVWDVLGACALRPGNYALAVNPVVLAIVKSDGGGQVEARVWDYVGARSLGSGTFSNAGWESKILELSDVPTPDGNGVAFVQLQFKTDGVEIGKCLAAGLEMY